MKTLKVLRAEKNFRQWDLHQATGINQARLSMIENGMIEPTEEEKEVIAKAFEVKPSLVNWKAA